MRLRSTLGRFMARMTVAATFVATVFAGAPALADQPADLVPNAARQPVFHRSQSLGTAIGTLSIPAIGLDEVVRAGVDASVIDRGVAHWSGTVDAGGAGNVVLAGHRTTHTSPFRDIGELAPGDLIYLTDGMGFEVIYRVRESFVVTPDALWITYDESRPTLTMFACHPKGSSRYRLVVTADLVSGRRIA